MAKPGGQFAWPTGWLDSRPSMASSIGGRLRRQRPPVASELCDVTLACDSTLPCGPAGLQFVWSGIVARKRQQNGKKKRQSKKVGAEKVSQRIVPVRLCLSVSLFTSVARLACKAACVRPLDDRAAPGVWPACVCVCLLGAGEFAPTDRWPGLGEEFVGKSSGFVRRARSFGATAAAADKQRGGQTNIGQQEAACSRASGQ